ncbi:putative DNA ligase [Lyophyllum shimeji]|uniref:DNA ligase n=1 Tax=Lyophyllum shimeji TaxID=47721 RepID=A0A9P3UT44_LYOSH|nr:putative DNA ligase [Lyophyllum shimeji]
MSDPPPSPISQLLHTLGITRQDLEKRSDQMRQFLTAENASSLRVTETNNPQKPLSLDTRPTSKPVSATAGSTRSRSRANSYTLRDATVPVTPVKTEPIEASAPLRHFDSMEMVIERQRRQSRRERKERREREREAQAKHALPEAPSPSPKNAPPSGFSLDSSTKSRVDARVSIQEPAVQASLQDESTSAAPVTPQRNKYYRDHTNLSGNTYSQPRKEQTAIKTESPSPARPRLPPQSSATQAQYLAYPQYLAYARLLPPLAFPNAQAGPSTLPATPQHQRTHNTLRTENSPLPPSSPPPASSPVSSPHRPVVNLVSSPGPMGPLPNEEEYETLPYTLPPGPYSPNKPDLSYAALVGQAILSSPEHRLTLQEIYDWITIVYPYFKRGETTWMNSIRHVLSTTVCFRKVPRERSVGRTQWAIWDEDLPCFDGGGFRKHLCKDIINSTAARDQGSKGKGKGRKRADTDDVTDARKAKRPRKDTAASLPAAEAAPSYMPATMSSRPLFPPTRPTPHHQPYYESCVQQTLPADVIFPPLPAGVGYNQVVPSAVTSSSSSTATDSNPQTDRSGSLSVEATPSSTQSDSGSASSLSVPGLTPNHSSSSPPLAPSELGAVSSAVDDVCLDDYITIGDDEDDEEEGRSALLSPVKYWGDSPKALDKSKAFETSLRPGIKSVPGGTVSSFDDDDQPLSTRSTAGTSPEARKLNKKISFPPMPTSPTLNRKGSSHVSDASKPTKGRKFIDDERPTTPTPSTPPRSTRQLPLSSIRTPLSSKGVNPAALHSEGDDDDKQGIGELDLNKTPRRRVVSSGVPGPAPVTPRRLVFPSNQNDSPFRTPGAGDVFSPFRTPGSRSFFDPHDPAALLDEELNRMGAGAGDSPTGLFGKSKGSLLYESPGYSTSPGKYPRWW